MYSIVRILCLYSCVRIEYVRAEMDFVEYEFMTRVSAVISGD